MDSVLLAEGRGAPSRARSDEPAASGREAVADPLGPEANWPRSLRTAFSMCRDSPFPTCLYWGPEYRLIYNEAWSPIAGEKHPWAFGRPGREVWPEIWHIIGPEFTAVYMRGEAVRSEDRLLPMRRHGYSEECYFNYSLSPIHDDHSGAIVGILNTVVETTYRVLNERRMRLLREVAERVGSARSVAAASAMAVEALTSDPDDVPFCLVYLIDRTPQGDVARLESLGGVTAGHSGAPAEILLDESTAPEPVWPLSRVLRTRQLQIVGDLPARFAERLPGGPWPEPARSAVVAPISATARTEQPVGFLIVGISSHRALDDAYVSFVELAADGLAGAISSGRAYDDERRRSEALARLDQAKTAFFSNVSHELRTPLTLVLHPIEEILARPEGPTRSDEAALEMVHRNARRLLKQVNALLDFSCIEADQALPVYEDIDLTDVTSELAETFRSLCQRAGLDLKVDCPPLGRAVRVDDSMWEKIVLNLLSNAFKFTLRGSIRVSLQWTRDHRAVVLEVADTGAGIPQDELEHVFERFHRVEGAEGRAYEGTGIGLALVHDLVKLLKGEVTVQSELGVGTCFRVVVPAGEPGSEAPKSLAKAEAAERRCARAREFVEDVARWLPAPGEQDDEYPAAASSPGASLPHVLLVEDNLDMRLSLKRLLVRLYSVTAVADGEEALRVLSELAEHPDLVLTDVMMPGMNGFELLRRLRADERTRTIPVIILSARGGEEARIAGLEADADDYVVKPFNRRELLARIRVHIEMARIRREAAAAVAEADRVRGKAERHDLLQRLIGAQERERLRIARDLHDQLGQDITGLALGLKDLEAALRPAGGLERLRRLRSLCDEMGKKIHRTAWELRPTALDDVGLLCALETYVADWSAHYGVTADLHATGMRGKSVDSEIETAVFRVIQEALTNVAKHAEAHAVSVLLDANEERLQVIVEDDGRGFDLEAARHGGRLGLAGMQERLSLVGGTLTIDTAMGKGTSLYARIPLQAGPSK